MESIPWESKKMRVTISEQSLQSTSSENLAPSISGVGDDSGPDTKWDTFGLMAPIVDFFKDGPKPDSKPYPQLSQLLRDGPSKVLEDHISIDSSISGEPLFRWIHVPVNKMDWAQTVVENVLKEPKNGETSPPLSANS